LPDGAAKQALSRLLQPIVQDNRPTQGIIGSVDSMIEYQKLDFDPLGEANRSGPDHIHVKERS
jgi:hypothetical protein